MKLFTTAIAAAALMTAADAKGFNGFYAGADVGMSNLNATWKTGSRNNTSDRENYHGSQNSASLGLFLGYNKLFTNCMSAGFEVGGDFLLNKKSDLARLSTSRYTTKRSGFNWDVVAKLGYLVNPKTLAFVGVGVKSNKIKFNYREVDTTPASFSVKPRSVRPTYQIGIENLTFSDTVALRIVYAFTQGSKKSISLNNNPEVFKFDNSGVVSKVSANEHQIKLGVSYRF